MSRKSKKKKKKNYIFPCPYVVLDIETTGYKENNSIIELSAVYYDRNGNIIRDYHKLIKPEKYDKEGVKNTFNIHKISDSELQEKGVDIKDALKELLEIMDCKYLVTHNGKSNDFPFIKKKIKEHLGLNRKFRNKRCKDTYQLSKKFLKLKNNKLEDVGKYFGHNTNGLHRTKKDVELINKCLINIIEKDPKRWEFKNYI